MAKSAVLPTQVNIPIRHQGQEKVWAEMFAHHKANGNRGFYTLIAHRGWWKSSFATYLIKYCMENGLNMSWAAPVEAPLINVWDDMMQKMFGANIMKQCLNKTERIFRIPECMQINFYSLYEATNVAGPTAPVFVVDEVGDINDNIISSVIMPIVEKAYIAYGWCLLLLTGTPNRNGRPFNDAYRYLQLGLSGESPDWKSWHIGLPAKPNENMNDLIPIPSPYAHPGYTFEWAQRSFKDAPNKVAWLIEWLCMFLSEEGRQFQEWKKALRTDFVMVQTEEGFAYAKKGYDPKGKHHQAGVDVGRVNDYNVIAVMNPQEQEMVYFHRYLPKTWGRLYKPLEGAMKAYPGRWLVDATGGGSHLPEHMAEHYGLGMEGVTFNQTNKPLLLDNLASALESGSLGIFDLQEIIRDLEDMQKKAREAGGYTIKAVKGGHDDIPMALSLMMMGIPLADKNALVQPATHQDLVALHQQYTQAGAFNTNYINFKDFRTY